MRSRGDEAGARSVTGSVFYPERKAVTTCLGTQYVNQGGWLRMRMIAPQSNGRVKVY